MTSSGGITAIVTAHRRVDQLLVTLSKLEACRPRPDEILIHIDFGGTPCEAAVRRQFPHLGVVVSETPVGPGGGRNQLVDAAAHPIVASFDDDSYPIDPDYFARVAELFARVPAASVIGAHVYHQHQAVAPDLKTAEWVADFSGGACAYRREHFLATGGYVPLETAYGMEEVDLALRLHAHGRRVLQTRWLRVFHDTDLARHAEPGVTAASIRNLALLAYLRYPATHWLIGLGQSFNRIWWLWRNGRRQGIVEGLSGIPRQLWQYRKFRRAVPAKQLRSYLSLRRHPIPANLEQRAP